MDRPCSDNTKKGLTIVCRSDIIGHKFINPIYKYPLILTLYMIRWIGLLLRSLTMYETCLLVLFVYKK